MEKSFVVHPNLPEKCVKTLLIGEKYAELLENSLQAAAIDVIKIPENPAVAGPVSHHVDLSVCHMGGGNVIISKAIFDSLHRLLPNGVNAIEAQRPQASTYPYDIGLNACIIGDRMFHYVKHTDENLLKAAKECRYRTYNVNQGYTKCSVCVINSCKLITADIGIHSLAVSLGMDSLQITPGNISLTGYDTGFIGGCAVKLNKNKIAFTGRLDGHPDAKKIIRFIESAGIEIIYLTDAPIFDVGSMIPLEESQ